MNIKRILALTLAAVLVLTIALAGCGQNEDASTPSTASGTDSASGADDENSTGGDASGVEQVLYLQQPELATWDTAMCVDSESSTMLSNVMEGLCQYHYTEDGQATLELAGATSYEVSDDGLVYTFHLVEDAVWSDGVPVTAHDYVFVTKRLPDGELAASYKFFADSIVGAREYFDNYSRLGVLYGGLCANHKEKIAMLDSIYQECTTTARAIGLSETQVVLHHVVRNSFIPIITFLPGTVAGVLSGSLFIENVFSIPGVGSYYVKCITERDVPIIMGMTVFYAAINIVAIFASDVLYGLVEPRIKITGGKTR